MPGSTADRCGSMFRFSLSDSPGRNCRTALDQRPARPSRRRLRTQRISPITPDPSPTARQARRPDLWLFLLAKQHAARERPPATIGRFVFAVGCARGALAESEPIMQAGQRFGCPPVGPAEHMHQRRHQVQPPLGCNRTRLTNFLAGRPLAAHTTEVAAHRLRHVHEILAESLRSLRRRLRPLGLMDCGKEGTSADFHHGSPPTISIDLAPSGWAVEV